MKKKLIGIEVLKEDKYKLPSHRIRLAGKPNLTPELVEALTTDERWMVRGYTAMRKDLTAEQIERLAKDKEGLVRHTIAKRKDLTAEQVKRLANDKNSLVRRSIIENPHAQEILNSK